MQYTIENLLSSAKVMSNFIHELEHYNITNMSGSAYREVRLAYYKNGILLVDNHHVDNLCSIKLNHPKDSTVTRGSIDSKYSGNAHPETTGEWVIVWINGLWVKPGVWQRHIELLLQELIDKLEFLKGEGKRVEMIRNLKVMSEIEEKYKSLEKEWS